MLLWPLPLFSPVHAFFFIHWNTENIRAACLFSFHVPFIDACSPPFPHFSSVMFPPFPKSSCIFVTIVFCLMLNMDILRFFIFIHSPPTSWTVMNLLLDPPTKALSRPFFSPRCHTPIALDSVLPTSKQEE